MGAGADAFGRVWMVIEFAAGASFGRVWSSLVVRPFSAHSRKETYKRAMFQKPETPFQTDPNICTTNKQELVKDREVLSPRLFRKIFPLNISNNIFPRFRSVGIFWRGSEISEFARVCAN